MLLFSLSPRGISLKSSFDPALGRFHPLCYKHMAHYYFSITFGCRAWPQAMLLFNQEN
jgi:hypothetical protein